MQKVYNTLPVNHNIRSIRGISENTFNINIREWYRSCSFV